MAGDPRKFAELMRAQGYSDDDIVAALKKVRGQSDELPVKLTDYSGENKAGPYTVGQQLKDAALARDPMAEGDPNTNDPRWQRLTGNTPADNQERERQELGRGFLGFAAGNVLGGAAAAGAARLGAGSILAPTVGGAVGGAAQTMAQGDATAGDIAKGAAFGAALPALAGGAQALGGAVMNSKGGQARALIEKHGGHVGPLDSGSGIPELDGLKTVTDADIGAQARASGKALLNANDQMFDQEGRQPYLAARGAIDQGAGQRQVEVSPLRQQMLKVAYDKATDPGTKAWLIHQADIIEQQHAGPMGTYVMTEQQVNGLKSMLQRSANPGLAPGAGSVRDAQLGSVAEVAKGIVDQGPYAQVNKDYAAAKDRSGDFREAFGMNRKPAANEQVDERRIANALARRGQTSTTAGIQGGDARLQQLEQAHPELQRTIAGPALVQAKGDLQFTLGDHVGGMIGRTQSKHALIAAARQNIPAIIGRVAYGPARALQGTGQAMSDVAVPTSQLLISAAQRKREQDTAVIDTIFGGGVQGGPQQQEQPGR